VAFDLSLTVHALVDASVVATAVAVAVGVGVGVVVTELVEPPHAARKVVRATTTPRRGSARFFTRGCSSRLRGPLTVRAEHESGSSGD
jgi:hypothetical protein